MPTDLPSNVQNAPMGFMVAGSEMVSFTLFGLLLDYLLGWMPVCTIVLTLLGVVAAFFQLMKMAKSLGKKKPEQAKDPTESN
jgi:F0F1-type ATP synthase assembly protein I